MPEAEVDVNAAGCPRCGATLLAGMRFCGQCGVRLTDASEGDRRQLTVLFSDLVGSTELSTGLDSEDLRDVLAAYHRLAAASVERFQGYIAQYLGDGVLAYFGYPRSHEDDAERGVRAGLQILEGLESVNRELESRLRVRLSVRVGLHTGHGVVAAGEGGDEIRMVGEAPNVAARVQHEAPTNGLAISEATDRLLPNRIQRHLLGTFTLKGLPEPVRLYQVRASHGSAGSSRGADLPLVDRQRELEQLRITWTAFLAGRGRAILLRGEPGIGKSRLLAVIRSWAEQLNAVWLECQCASMDAVSAFRPLIQLVPYLNARAVAQVEYLAGLEDTVGSVAPAKRRQEAINQLISEIVESARDRPTVLVVEDLHWSDASTAELLQGFVSRTDGQLLFVLTSRKDYTAPLGGRIEVLDLERLPEKDTRELLGLVAGPLDAEVSARLLLGSDGVPLFAVELVRSWREAELAGVPNATVPMTLHDALMARLDRIPRAKATAQLASVLGREFSHSLLMAVHSAPRAAVAQDIETLVGSGVVVSLPGDEEQYAFSHALLRDVAYQSLLRKTRQMHHARAARALLEQFPRAAELAPEVVAYHFAQGGEAAEAITQWQRAARRALLRSANQEAISHLSSGLSLLDAIADKEARNRHELQLRVGIGAALVGLEGYGSPNAEAHYEQARRLGEAPGSSPELGPVRFGLLAFYLARGKLRTALGLAEEMHRVGLEIGSDEIQLEAAFALGMAHFYLGELPDAERALVEGISLYRPDEHRHLAASYVFDPGVGCRRSLALALWLRGETELAWQRAHEAVELARIVAHPYSLASALVFGAILHELADERAECLAAANAALDLSVANGFGFWQVWATILRGWARGDATGSAEMEATVARYQASGARLLLPYFLGLVGMEKLRAGFPDEAGDLARQALHQARSSAERWFIPELHRLLFGATGSREEIRRARRAANANGATALERRYASL